MTFPPLSLFPAIDQCTCPGCPPGTLPAYTPSGLPPILAYAYLSGNQYVPSGIVPLSQGLLPPTTPFHPSMQINPGAGNLALTLGMPPVGPVSAQTQLTYNSDTPAASEYGYGWSGTFKRTAASNGNRVTVTKGDGSTDVYTNFPVPPPGYWMPTAGVKNSLYQPAMSQPIIEYQPNGLKFNYPSASGGNVRSIAAPGGGGWSVDYSGTSSRVLRIVDPANAITTYFYDASNNLRRILEPTGQIYSMTVDGNGNLTRVIASDGTRLSMTYDGSHKLKSVTNPQGDRLSFTWDGSGRVQQLIQPLGQRITYSYGTNRTAITSGCGYRTTLTFYTDGTLRSVQANCHHQSIGLPDQLRL